MESREMYLSILQRLNGNEDDIYKLKKFINCHFDMINFMKEFTLYDVFSYERKIPNMMKESMKMVLDQNAELKAEVNTLRKKVGKIEKYKVK